MSMQENSENGVVKKTRRTKEIGLKTIIVANERVVVASFANSKTIGEYQCANIEKITDLQGTEQIGGTPRMFDTKVDPCKVSLVKRAPVENDGVKRVVLDNPAANSDIGRDYVGIKGALEREFFGKEFSGDNLHVQIAYNVIDIKKILGTYVNNVINIFYNLNRSDDDGDRESYDDLIGTLYVYKTIQQQEKRAEKDCARNKPGTMKRLIKVKDLLVNTSSYYKYFGTLFKPVTEDDSLKSDNVSHNYNVLRVLSLLRQLCVHSTANNDGDEEFNLSERQLFNLEKVFADENMRPLKTLVHDVYAQSKRTLLQGFVETSKNNLYILTKVFAREPRKQIIESYYRMVMRTDELNMGVNVKHLREIMLKEKLIELLDSSYDVANYDDRLVTYRSKMYLLFNYILFRTLIDHDDVRVSMVAQLRANPKDEVRKEAIYGEYADKLWALCGSDIKNCVRILEEEKEAKFENKIEGSEIAAAVLGNPNTSISGNKYAFIELLFMLCKFLDGKEINELLSALINKFNNIGDLMEMARGSDKIKIGFVPDYAMLNDCRGISEELYILKNIAGKEFRAIKKKKATDMYYDELSEQVDYDDEYTESLYRDALALLGMNIVRSRDKNGEIVLTDEYKAFKSLFFEQRVLNKYGEYKCDTSGKFVIDHRVRNFVFNNVMRSKWFFYVIKYNSPVEVRKLMQNEALVRLVLDALPASLVDRYYKSVSRESARTAGTYEEKKKALLDMLNNMSAKGIIDAISGMSADTYREQNIESDKEKYKALIQLYLMIAYQITKNLVKVNTRFNIAFSALERDFLLRYDDDAPDDEEDVDFRRLTDEQMLRITLKYLADDKKIYEKWRDKSREIIALGLPREERNRLLRANERLRKEIHFSKKWQQHLNADLDELRRLNRCGEKKRSACVLKNYRNVVAHLNVVSKAAKLAQGVKADSFYGVYCFCLQKLLLQDTKSQGSARAELLLKRLNETGTYLRDLMWNIDLPFAYNLARYKNLSNEDLFNERDARVIPAKDAKKGTDGEGRRD